MELQNQDTSNEKHSNFEATCGVFIAIFAAIMAVSDLFAGKYGDDEIIGSNEKAAAYMWYQSKSIKESLAEGERSLLASLKDAGVLQASSALVIEHHLMDVDKKLSRYRKEKTEILKGSQTVGKENWVQELNGELGKVIGAQEIEARLNVLSAAGDRFDFASLMFQVSLVLGAMSLILKKESLRKIFFFGMCSLGIIGTFFSGWAFLIVQ
jgi:hypothetical protein